MRIDDLKKYGFVDRNGHELELCEEWRDMVRKFNAMALTFGNDLGTIQREGKQLIISEHALNYIIELEDKVKKLKKYGDIARSEKHELENNLAEIRSAASENYEDLYASKAELEKQLEAEKKNSIYWQNKEGEVSGALSDEKERNAFLERENAQLKEAHAALRACLKVLL